MARLTASERSLLAHPPTRTTWLCLSPTHKTISGVLDPIANGGSNQRCWVCGSRKPARPKLLWPEYELACKKAGIDATGVRAVEAPANPSPSPSRKIRRKI